MIKRILVALSGTPYTKAAAQHALELANQHKATLTGVTDIDLAKVASVGPVPMGASAAAHDLMEHRLKLTEEQVEKAIERFHQACEAAGVKGNVVRERGDPYDTLISVWRYHDIVVAGLRGLFEYGVLREPDDVLLRLISKGVRPIIAVAKQFRPVRRALVAYNGSMESAKAMKQFIQLALWPDPTVKVVCYGRRNDDRTKLLAEAAAYCRVYGIEAETELVDADPKDRLLEDAAQWNADLIVMGSTRRMRLFQHVLGDLVLHAVRESDLPLFLTQ